jgi:hypothetical protein
MVAGLVSDPDLAALRKEPKFDSVLAEARRSQQAGHGP